MEDAYAAMGWRYHFIHAGVGDDDHHDGLTFYHIGKGNKELERGFTTVQSKCRRECRPEKVPVIRLSDWIDREIHGRIIPAAAIASRSSQQNKDSNKRENKEEQPPPRVVMKMDIEMYEWVVFPDLLSSGVL
ncbi:hypothetical protein ACHAXR_005461 [Thalassiosira sp. AJA248-18]